MLKFLQEYNGKSAQIVAATADMKVGTPLDDGHFVAMREIQYNGENAVYTPRPKDNDDIKTGDLYTRVPVLKGERIATDLVTDAAGLTQDDPITVTDGKFAKETVAGDGAAKGGYKFCGEYANTLGVTMYILERTLP